MRDLEHNVKDVLAVNITSINADGTTTGNTIDCKGFGSCKIVVFSGTITDGSYAVKLFESDNSDMNSEETEITDSNRLHGSALTFGANDDNVVKSVGVKLQKRYLRVKIVASSVSNGGSLGAIALLGEPQHAPTN